MRRKTIKSVCFIISIFLGLSLSTSINAIADCPGGGSPRQEELGKLLLKTDYTDINCRYLGQPYNWKGNQAHPGIDYRGSSGTSVYAPVKGEYILSATEIDGKASYVILPNKDRLFILHMQDLILGEREKGQEIGFIYLDHVHAELRVGGYSGKYLVGADSCGGTCTLDEIEEKTDDPSEVVAESDPVIPEDTVEPTTTTTTVKPTTTTNNGIYDRAIFVNENYPDNTKVAGGTSLTKVWTVKNTGTR